MVVYIDDLAQDCTNMPDLQLIWELSVLSCRLVPSISLDFFVHQGFDLYAGRQKVLIGDGLVHLHRYPFPQIIITLFIQAIPSGR